RQPVLEKLLPAKVLIIRVLDPQLAHDFVAQVVSVLQDRKPCHQPRRQRRLAGAVLVDRAQPLFQEPPVDRPRKLHQRVLYIDDLVEPRAKQILFAGLPPLPWPHRSPPPISSKGRESRLEIRGNPRKRICKKIDTQTPISGKS